MPKLGNTPQIALRESKAAASVDLSLTDFRKAVRDGVMPKPRRILGHERWIVKELHASLLAGSSGESSGFEI